MNNQYEAPEPSVPQAPAELSIHDRYELLVKARHELRETVEKLQKEVENKARSAVLYQERSQKTDAEIEQLHAFFDSLETPPPKTQANGYGTLSIATRFMIYLSRR